MSYGIWKKSGKGWCSIEIDSPGNNDSTLVDYRFKQHKGCWKLIDQLDHYGFKWNWHDDIACLRWILYQLKTQPTRSIVEAWSGGEHMKWIAFETKEQLEKAMADSPDDKVEPIVFGQCYYSKGMLINN